FFQAEDGIRDFHVTGVQTCALPISGARSLVGAHRTAGRPVRARLVPAPVPRPRLRRDRPMTSKRPTKPSKTAQTKKSATSAKARSEERRGGKECRTRRSAYSREKHR